MRWPAIHREWKRRFAWFPQIIGDEWVWLEHYEVKDEEIGWGCVRTTSRRIAE
jgi:hypothetical protein